MKIFLNFCLGLLLTSTLALADEITVLTYNMGQLKKSGVDLVACTKPRLQPQVEALFGQDGVLVSTQHFVLLLQEVWTKRSYQALQKVAQERGLLMLPKTSLEASVTGTVTITDLPLVTHGFEEFSVNKYLPKGILHATLELPSGGTLNVANVHTGYSDSKSFSFEHKIHFEDIHRFLMQRLSVDAHTVIGGDFNAGPDMAFKKQRYLPVPIIWQANLLRLMTDLGFLHASAGVAPTWDTRNALVNTPAVAIRAVNGMTYNTWGWEEKTATLDHVFTTPGLQMRSTKTVLNKRVRMRCKGRTDSEGKAHLSDHYGVLTVLGIR